MDGEIKNFIMVWITAILSQFYCYYIVAMMIPKGMMRLLSLLPIFCLYIILPCYLNTIHLGGFTVFFLVWLGNFKLILFAFDQGPLSPPPPKPLHFISIACLPIQLKQDPSLNTKNSQIPTHKNCYTHPSPITHNDNPTKVPKAFALVIKALILAMIICTYDYRTNFHPYVLLALYATHIYLAIEIGLALAAAAPQAIFGFELEPHFNKPYLSTSLQNFWGHRWNLMATYVLRPTVYKPIHHISTNIIGSRWAFAPAIISTFLLSGLIHEVIYFYFTRVNPTWEVTCFFVLNGICTTFEVMVKKRVTNKWRLHGAVSGPLTIGFLAVTGVWLFFPQLLRNGVDERVIKESLILFDFVKANLPLSLPLEKS